VASRAQNIKRSARGPRLKRHCLNWPQRKTCNHPVNLRIPSFSLIFVIDEVNKLIFVQVNSRICFVHYCMSVYEKLIISSEVECSLIFTLENSQSPAFQYKLRRNSRSTQFLVCLKIECDFIDARWWIHFQQSPSAFKINNELIEVLKKARGKLFENVGKVWSVRLCQSRCYQLPCLQHESYFASCKSSWI
jgi:hypothetical protein